MSATNAASLVTDANSYQSIAAMPLALQIQIYLLQQIAGNTMSAQQLIDAATGFQLIRSPILAQQVIIYLLGQLTGGGGGSGGLGGVTSGNYGVGNPPNFIPTTGAAISINLDDGVEWTYFNGKWQ